MSSISWPLSYIFPNQGSESLENKKTHFNPVVRATYAQISPAESFYHRADYTRFKEESKTSLESLDLGVRGENGEENTFITRVVKIVEEIFKKALDYLNQFFGLPSNLNALEKGSSSADFSPPRKKCRVRNQGPEEENRWLLIPSSLSLQDVDNGYIMVVKSSLRSSEETTLSMDANLEDNTRSNAAITSASSRLKAKFKRKRALSDMESV